MLYSNSHSNEGGSIPPSPLQGEGETPINPRAVSFLFKTALNDQFNQWNASTPLRTGMPHASAILAPESEWCLRKLILLALYPEQAERPEQKPWDAHTNAVYLNGWHLHEKYQKLLTRFGEVVEVETPHYDEERLLYFTPDAIVRHCGRPMIVEIKGYKASHFEQLHEAGPPPDYAHKQSNLYMHLLKMQLALILVECKDTQDVKVWCVPYNREMVQPQINRIYQFKGALVRARNSGTLPARVCSTPNDRNASKCEACGMCFFHRADTPLQG